MPKLQLQTFLFGSNKPGLGSRSLFLHIIVLTEVRNLEMLLTHKYLFLNAADAVSKHSAFTCRKEPNHFFTLFIELKLIQTTELLWRTVNLQVLKFYLLLFLSPPHGTRSHIRVQWCILKATFQNDCVIQSNKCRKQIMMPLRPPKYQFPPLTVFQSLQVFKNNTKAICLRT